MRGSLAQIPSQAPPRVARGVVARNVRHDPPVRTVGILELLYREVHVVLYDGRRANLIRRWIIAKQRGERLEVAAIATDRASVGDRDSDPWSIQVIDGSERIGIRWIIVSEPRDRISRVGPVRERFPLFSPEPSNCQFARAREVSMLRALLQLPAALAPPCCNGPTFPSTSPLRQWPWASEAP